MTFFVSIYPFLLLFRHSTKGVLNLYLFAISSLDMFAFAIYHHMQPKGLFLDGVQYTLL
jgi:hypothetical protein